MAGVFFWADTHFNHASIIRYCSRGYESVGQMNESLIAAWNGAVLSERDEVWLLGDFAFKHPAGEDVGVLFHRLRGRKHLIIGNHDERNPSVLKLPWETVDSLRTFKLMGSRAELCHYPLETWKSAHHGVLMLHGHSHGTLKRALPHRFDVGVDVEPAPVEWGELVARAAKQTFLPSDHHGDL